jgi:hypothetical protein
MFSFPNADIVDPTLQFFLKLIDEPRCMKSAIDRWPPKRENARIEIELPKVVLCITDIL